nr:unnamed protein product [Spirometra erinaceieuropaei]
MAQPLPGLTQEAHWALADLIYPTSQFVFSTTATRTGLIEKMRTNLLLMRPDGLPPDYELVALKTFYSTSEHFTPDLHSTPGSQLGILLHRTMPYCGRTYLCEQCGISLANSSSPSTSEKTSALTYAAVPLVSSDKKDTSKLYRPKRRKDCDHSIVVVLPDKDGATVIMDKTDYVNKADLIFSDTDSYTILAEDPRKKQAATIMKKVNELARLKVIGPDDSKFMTLSDPHIAHAYGLSKVHKIGAPLRIIVPLIGPPTYNLAKWLYKHLKPLTHGSRYSINSSQEFLNRMEGLNVSTDEFLLSFDVVALFSSIPHDLAIDCVAQRLQDNPVGIPAQHVIELLKLRLKNYCKFDNMYYQQVKGSSMGSQYPAYSPN